MHRESQEIIYFKAIDDLDPSLLDKFRSSIQSEILNLPLDEGGIEQATLEGKYLITRAGKMVWVSLIVNQKPVLITREILSSFCIKFENLFKQEIIGLYTKFNGDISIFMRGSDFKDTNKIINNDFYLNFTFPYKISSLKVKKLSPKSQKLYQLGRNLSHKTKGHFLLKNLLAKANNILQFSIIEITDIIYDLVKNNTFLSIPLKQIKNDTLLH